MTRQITRAVANIVARRREKLYLGNLDAKRDWGFAGDYVLGMWLMLRRPTADDYVLATGASHSVKEFLQEAFSHGGLDWTQYVEVDSK